jgi:hypothetical protein
MSSQVRWYRYDGQPLSLDSLIISQTHHRRLHTSDDVDYRVKMYRYRTPNMYEGGWREKPSLRLVASSPMSYFGGMDLFVEPFMEASNMISFCCPIREHSDRLLSSLVHRWSNGRGCVYEDLRNVMCAASSQVRTREIHERNAKSMAAIDRRMERKKRCKNVRAT